MIAFRDIGVAWHNFFFAPEPPTTLAVFRILFGSLVIIHGLLLWKDARFWLGPNGIFASHHYRKVYTRPRFSLITYLPQTESAVRSVLVAHIGAAICLTLGLVTPLSAFCVFITLVSIHQRNAFMTHSGDSVLRLMSFLLIFSPAGAVLSLDHLFFRATSEIPLVSPWCMRLMQLQISLIYWRSFTLKCAGQRWRDGTAAYYPTQTHDYRRFGLPRYLNSRFAIAVATWGTLAIEFALGPLIWITELRYPIMLGGIFFHLILEYFMNLQLFGWIMVVCLLLFLSPADVTTVLHTLHILP